MSVVTEEAFILWENPFAGRSKAIGIARALRNLPPHTDPERIRVLARELEEILLASPEHHIRPGNAEDPPAQG